jgi:protein gp37
MAEMTDIQWVDGTINPTMGCDGCELWTKVRKTCYAGKLHTLRRGRPGYAPTFEEVTLFPGRMAEAASLPNLNGLARPQKPWLDDLPRLIFVSDMSDALSKVASFSYLHAEVIATVTGRQGRRHQWLWLTKLPKRMAEFSDWLAKGGRPWPPNLWAGTSITTQGTTIRIDPLLKVGNDQTIHFLSVEPQWQAIDLRKWLPRLHWVIQGGESGSKKAKDIMQQPHEFKMEWAYDLRQQCKDTNVPYFLKQLGSNVTRRDKPFPLADSHGGDWAEWPKPLRVREMPALSSSKP